MSVYLEHTSTSLLTIDVEPLVAKLPELLKKLPAVIRQAAVLERIILWRFN
jgi:hypothetical protein